MMMMMMMMIIIIIIIIAVVVVAVIIKMSPAAGSRDSTRGRHAQHVSATSWCGGMAQLSFLTELIPISF